MTEKEIREAKALYDVKKKAALETSRTVRAVKEVYYKTRDERDTAYAALKVAQRQCKHPEIHLGVCQVCGRTRHGWACPDSPDGVCAYYSHESRKKPGRRYVWTLKGAHYLKKKHDPENETDDECLFCGAPEERK